MLAWRRQLAARCCDAATVGNGHSIPYADVRIASRLTVTALARSRDGPHRSRRGAY